MADSNRDSDSVGSAVACKARKGAEGSFAKLWGLLRPKLWLLSLLVRQLAYSS